MPSTAVMCCCSSVKGTGVAGTAGAGGVEGPATVGDGASLLVVVVVVAFTWDVDTTGAGGGGGEWDCDKGDGPGRATEGPGRLSELGPGRASPFDCCDACWGW